MFALGVPDPKSGTYEGDSAYYRRIKNDLKRNQRLLQKHTGARYRTIVWPYGRDSQLADNIARDVGMAYSMVLDEPANQLADLPIIKGLSKLSANSYSHRSKFAR